MKTVKGHDERRRELVQTARALFVQYGVEDTSISRIVGELQIAHGLFYYYFKSKEEVVQAVVEAMLEDFEQALARRMARAGDDFCAGLMCLITTMFDSFPKPAVDLRPHNLIMSRYHDRLLTALHKALESLWATGTRQGLFPQQNAKAAFQIVMTGSLYMIEKEKITKERVAEVIAQLLRLPHEAAARLMTLSGAPCAAGLEAP